MQHMLTCPTEHPKVFGQNAVKEIIIYWLGTKQLLCKKKIKNKK